MLVRNALFLLSAVCLQRPATGYLLPAAAARNHVRRGASSRRSLPLRLLSRRTAADGETTQADDPVSSACIAALSWYKKNVSPLLPGGCRFKPTCSEYARESFERFPPGQAAILTVWRLIRCNPYHAKSCGCGVDEPCWPPPAYWAGDGTVRTFLDDEASRARARGKEVEPTSPSAFELGARDTSSAAREVGEAGGGE